jgi:hypothetical protein
MKPPREDVNEECVPQQLSPDDREHHIALVGRIKGARELAQAAARAEAAFAEWADYLKDKYAFTEHDSIGEDGHVTRTNVPASSIRPDSP